MDINKDDTVISNEGRVGKKEKSGKKKHKEEEYKDASLLKKKKRKEERKDGRELEMRKKKRKGNVAEVKTDLVDDNDEMGLIEANDQKKEKKEKKTKDDIIVVEEQKKVAKEKKKNVEKRAIEGEMSIPNHSGIFDKSLDGGKANCKNQTEKENKKKKDNVVQNKEEESWEKKKKKKDKETKTNDEMGLIEANDQKKKEKKEKKEKKTKDDIIVDEEQKKVAKEKKKNVEKMVIREGETSIPNHSGIFDKSLDGGKANCKNQTEKAKKKKKDNVVHNKEEESREKKKKKDKETKTNDNIAVNSSNPVKPKSKKVSFSDKLKVYPPTDDGANSSPKKGDDGYVRGKRFTPEEDEIIKQAVYDYIDEHNLGEEGLEMVLNCNKHKEARGCWNEICMALPNRPHESIYLRAHTLFERDDTRRWSKEEVDRVRQYHEQHGPCWAKMAKEMGKFRHHVKEVWRRIRLPNRNIGNWSQEEYQTLFELVNKDLQMKVLEEKKKRHSMLRDNIGWEAISTKMGTRATAPCCRKWYYQLTSPMVAEGIWDDADDYRLLMRLVDVDASCDEEVDWDNLLEHRSGDVCRQRWNQMWNHLGEHGIKTWSEQVDVLSKRYCPDLLEVREEVNKQREW